LILMAERWIATAHRASAFLPPGRGRVQVW
jgi:hypothetical protein